MFVAVRIGVTEVSATYAMRPSRVKYRGDIRIVPADVNRRRWLSSRRLADSARQVTRPRHTTDESLNLLPQHEQAAAYARRAMA